ncbi:MAG: IclR family transcriptional regulator C-terminal domain-containing protein [Solirubrobacterales bacterium]
MTVRREVLGDEHVDRAVARTTPFTEPFQDFITRTAWGDVWARPGLDRKTRSIITLTALTAIRAEGEIGMHVRAAIGNGLTPRRSPRSSCTPRSTPACRRPTRRSRSPRTCSRRWGSTRRDRERPRGRRRRGRPAHFVQSLERGRSVIRAFSADAPELTLSDGARRTGLTRAAARRFLLTLVDLHYVRTDGHVFWLSPRVLELGYAYLSSMSLTDVAEPHLERLVAEVRESSSVSVLEGDDVIYVARVPVSRIMTVSINVGTRFAAYATSMGRVMLAGLDAAALEDYLGRVEIVPRSPRAIDSPQRLRAELDRVRAQGYALVDGELDEGLRSVAVPIHDRDGAVAAAVNLSTHASRRTIDAMRKDLLPPLRETAARIEADLQAATGGRRTRRSS